MMKAGMVTGRRPDEEVLVAQPRLQPAADMPGTIMPSAIRPVQMA